MKQIEAAVLVCPQCDSYFSTFPTFYSACNDCPILQCDNEGVGHAWYRVHCPECGIRIEESESLHKPHNGRQES